MNFFPCSDSFKNTKTVTLFDRIRSDILTEIFLFLNLSNIRNVISVNKRFRTHLLKNDSRIWKEIANLTYGLNKHKDILFTIPDYENYYDIKIKHIKSIKSNLHPIQHMVLMSKINLIASAAGNYDEGLLLWNNISGVQENKIQYKNHIGDKDFVTCMCYMEEANHLVVSYLEGDLFVYNMNQANSKEKDSTLNEFDRLPVIWSKKIATDSEPIQKIIYVDSKGVLITLEQSIDFSINFIKIWEGSDGTHILSSVFSHSIITSLRSFDFNINDNFLIAGLSDGKIFLKNLTPDHFEKNYFIFSA